MNKPDIPPELAQLCDPWLQHLWGLRGTYNGTLIDKDHLVSCDPKIERLFHGSNKLRPQQDP
jgi:hypothetical protein